jgi:hypothetical protein
MADAFEIAEGNIGLAMWEVIFDILGVGEHGM